MQKGNENNKRRHSKLDLESSRYANNEMLNQVQHDDTCFNNNGVVTRPSLVTPVLRRAKAGYSEGKRGFTLVELLVVVLIIGILTAVALPQYQKAVDKSRVAAMIPLMRRWADALALYKLENGSYAHADITHPSADEIGVSWPSGWNCSDTLKVECWNDLWTCFANEEYDGGVTCTVKWKGDPTPWIHITQPDDTKYPAGKRFCYDNESFCKSLGGKPIPGDGVLFGDDELFEF